MPTPPRLKALAPPEASASIEEVRARRDALERQIFDLIAVFVNQNEGVAVTAVSVEMVDLIGGRGRHMTPGKVTVEISL